MPFMDDMPPEDDAVPVGAVELLLGLAVVPVPLAVPDEDAAGAVGCDVLGFGALWQPANAKRTAEAKINFFIICSPISIGGWRSVRSSATVYPMSSPLSQTSSRSRLVIWALRRTTPLEGDLGPRA